MARRLRIAAALILIAAFAFLAWSGVGVGLWAFELHRDNPPWVYLTFGGVYIALGVMCRLGSLLLLKHRV